MGSRSLRQAACTRCETRRASRAATVAAASGGGAVAAEANMRGKTRRRGVPGKKQSAYTHSSLIASVTWVLALLTFASSDFIVS